MLQSFTGAARYSIAGGREGGREGGDFMRYIHESYTLAVCTVEVGGKWAPPGKFQGYVADTFSNEMLLLTY